MSKGIESVPHPNVGQVIHPSTALDDLKNKALVAIASSRAIEHSDVISWAQWQKDVAQAAMIGQVSKVNELLAMRDARGRMVFGRR